jgi:hypothetical protein
MYNENIEEYLKQYLIDNLSIKVESFHKDEIKVSLILDDIITYIHNFILNNTY